MCGEAVESPCGAILGPRPQRRPRSGPAAPRGPFKRARAVLRSSRETLARSRSPRPAAPELRGPQCPARAHGEGRRPMARRPAAGSPRK